MAFVHNELGLFSRDVYLKGGGHGRVDEAADDGGDLLLDGGLVAVRMTEVLYPWGDSGTSSVSVYSVQFRLKLLILHSMFYLIPLDLQPEEHVILQKVSLQGNKVLELHTGDGVEQDLSKKKYLFGGTHPQTFSLQGDKTKDVKDSRRC